MEVCMVSSIDGGTAVEGRSGGLSTPADAELLQALRATADVVLVGASTVRSESYGPPKKPGLKIGVVTTTGEGLDFDGPLFSSGAGFLVMPSDGPERPVNTLRCGTGSVDLARATRRLGASFIHVEGGPKLNGALLHAGLVDEVNLTISPHLVGGNAARLIDGASAVLQRMRLSHVLEDDGWLFCRYLRLD
ncbi:MAG: dihydrofolate reductase family protein [Ilumatobacteraceae bacterium]